jgi:hypothetical protein
MHNQLGARTMEVVMKRSFLGVAAVVLGIALVSGLELQTASAADPAPTTVTLPLFGVPLTLDVTTDVGGGITNVAVDSADPTVATHLKPHKVVFQSANPNDPTGDPARVVVKSRHGGQSVSARAGSLADVSGNGHWGGDVFGNGTPSTVDFTIGAATDGSPDITGITHTGEAAVVGDVQHDSGDGHDDHEGDESSQSARVKVTFTNVAGDQSRTLVISVRVHTGGDEGDGGAKLSIALGRIKGVAVDATVAAGTHTWNGTLCDGSAASITYTVAADGSVSGVSAVPATADVHSDGGKIIAKFSDHEWVFVGVHAKDGMIKISSGAMLRCKSGDPTTNVPISIPIPDSSGDHQGGNFGGGDHKGGHHGGD